MPKIQLPRGSCDTHFHVFGPAARFPFAAQRTYTPEDRPKERVFALHQSLGIERGVVVQSAAHGFDNAAAADLLAANRNYKGVALVPCTADTETLHKLDAQGFCGARFNYMKHLGEGPPIAEVIAFSNTLKDMGWHLQIHMDSSLIATLGEELKKSAVPVVIDHMGRVDASKGLQQEPFSRLVELLKEQKNFWVKVSCCERASRKGPPYDDAVPFARRLVEMFPERTLWGTDWPHPNVQPVPDDRLLVDLLSEIAPQESQRKALLVDNPARFYGFQA